MGFISKIFNKKHKIVKSCRHEWEHCVHGEVTLFGKLSGGEVHGWFCKRCGKLKLDDKMLRTHAEVHRDNFFASKEGF